MLGQFNFVSTLHQMWQMAGFGSQQMETGSPATHPLTRFILFRGVVGKAAMIKMEAVTDEVPHPR